MEGLLQETSSTGILLDNTPRHRARIWRALTLHRESLGGLSDADLRLKAEKCKIYEVSFGVPVRIDAEGFYSVDAKMKDNKRAQVPNNPSEFNSFLGMPTSMASLCPTYLQPRSHCTSYWGNIPIGNGVHSSKRRLKRLRIGFNHQMS